MQNYENYAVLIDDDYFHIIFAIEKSSQYNN